MNIAKRIVAGLQLVVMLVAQLPLLISLWMIFGKMKVYSRLFPILLPFIFLIIALSIFAIASIIGHKVAVYVGAALSGLSTIIISLVVTVNVINKDYVRYFSFSEFIWISMVSLIMMISVVLAGILHKFNKGKAAYIVSFILIAFNNVLGLVGVLCTIIPQTEYVVRMSGGLFPRLRYFRFEFHNIFSALFGYMNLTEVYRIVSAVTMLLTITICAIVAVIPDKKKALNNEQD